MPAGVEPGAVAEDEDFGAAAGGGGALVVLLGLVEVGGVEDGGVAVELNVGAGEFEADEFGAGRGEAAGAFEDGGAVGPVAGAGVDGEGLAGDGLLQLLPVAREPGAPDGLARRQERLPLVGRGRPRLAGLPFELRADGVRVGVDVRADLRPLAVQLGVDVDRAELARHAGLLAVPGVGDVRDERRVAVEDVVDLRDLVVGQAGVGRGGRARPGALGAAEAGGVVHVGVDAAEDRARLPGEADPVRGVGRADGGAVAVDVRLEDALDVGADGGAVGVVAVAFGRGLRGGRGVQGGGDERGEQKFPQHDLTPLRISVCGRGSS